MMISVTEPDCKHLWHIDNSTTVVKNVLVGQGRVTVEFMDSKAYQKGVDNRGNQYRMLNARVDLSPDSAYKLAHILFEYAAMQQQEQDRIQESDE